LTIWYFSPQSEHMASVIRAFSAFHVCRLTGLSLRQLSYWDDTGFFSPYYASENSRSPFGRVYSFEDLVGLRVIAILRNDHKIPLQKLRKIAEQLSAHHPRPWSGLVLYVRRKNVFFKEPDTAHVRKTGHPQYVFTVALDGVTTDMQSKADALRRRREDQIGRLERHRNVVHNAWVVAGTRIPTKTVWRYHQAGYDAPSIIRDYPLLTPADIASAISHERQLARKAS
jgi:DNA-binding transcriptional MerR regulator